MLNTCRLRPVREILVQRFTEDELETVCFDLGVPYDHLPGQGTPAKARELLLYLDRRQSIPALLAVCRKHRPDIDWDEVERLTGSPIACLRDPQVWTAVVIAAGVLLVAAALILSSATRRLPESSPTPASSFVYGVQVLSEDANRPLPGARVILELAGAAPMDALADSDGIATFELSLLQANRPARLIVEASGYQRLTLNNLALTRQAPLHRVRLKPAPEPSSRGSWPAF